MKTYAGCLLLILLAALPAWPRSKKPVQTGWGYIESGPVEVYQRTSFEKRPQMKLRRGAQVPVYETKTRGGKNWVQVQAVDPATLEPTTGWMDGSRLQILPKDAFPSDDQLLDEMGGQYLQDFVARHTNFARYLIHLGGSKTALVCYLGSVFVPQCRLQVFENRDGQFHAGSYLEFPFSAMKSGITEIEVNDLAGGECLVTHEPFRLQARNEGVNMVIRRVAGVKLETLWKAPLEFTNLASFPPRMQILEPPAKNIGAPGTVTKATVDFQEHDGARVPVWKGSIEFHIIGREKPVKTLQVEKVCTWTGSAFAPVE